MHNPNDSFTIQASRESGERFEYDDFGKEVNTIDFIGVVETYPCESLADAIEMASNFLRSINGTF